MIRPMQEELSLFVRNDVEALVEHSQEVNVIGTKQVFKNKIDEYGVVTFNKARLVAQGYTQIEGVDFDETFILVACHEAIKMFISIAYYLNIKLYQIDFKSMFLNEVLQEKVYVE